MRIAIVDDSKQTVDALTRLLAFVSEYELAWVAEDGIKAVERCSIDTPDLVLMDLYMPLMDGVEATRQIMQNTPCTILIVTDSISEHSAQIFEAMGHGAVDVAAWTSDAENGFQSEGDTLLEKIATIGKLIGRSQQQRSLSLKRRVGDAPAKSPHPLVAIGSSTGGPMALATILSQMPNDFPGAIVIVQHLDAEFSQGLASWLDGYTSLSVEVARHGSHPHAGTVSVAGRDNHLVVGPDLTLHYTPQPRGATYRPSVDVFFNSVAENWPSTDVAVLLTGMGRDGAAGLLNLRNLGWHTIAQDESTSAVYGMPKAAAEMKAAVKVAPLDEIGTVLTMHVSSLHSSVASRD